MCDYDDDDGQYFYTDESYREYREEKLNSWYDHIVSKFPQLKKIEGFRSMYEELWEKKLGANDLDYNSFEVVIQILISRDKDL